MTYRQIETARELRLWLTQVVMPVAIGTGVVIMSIPEARETVRGWFKKGR